MAEMRHPFASLDPSTLRARRGVIQGSTAFGFPRNLSTFEEEDQQFPPRARKHVSPSEKRLKRVRADSDNYYVRILANAPPDQHTHQLRSSRANQNGNNKDDTSLASIGTFRRAKRVLQSFDLVLIGEWEQDPAQRRALLNLLLRTGLPPTFTPPPKLGSGGDAVDGVGHDRTPVMPNDKQQFRNLSDEAVAALLGLDVKPRAPLDRVFGSPASATASEGTGADAGEGSDGGGEKGKQGGDSKEKRVEWIKEHSNHDLRLFGQVSQPRPPPPLTLLAFALIPLLMLNLLLHTLTHRP